MLQSLIFFKLPQVIQVGKNKLQKVSFLNIILTSSAPITMLHYSLPYSYPYFEDQHWLTCTGLQIPIPDSNHDNFIDPLLIFKKLFMICTIT